MAEDIQNKNAAAEDDIGTVHRMVNNGYKMKLGEQLKKAKKSKSAKHISTPDLNAAAAWCRYNKVVGSNNASEELGGVVDELEAIRMRQRGNSCKAVGDD